MHVMSQAQQEEKIINILQIDAVYNCSNITIASVEQKEVTYTFSAPVTQTLEPIVKRYTSYDIPSYSGFKSFTYYTSFGKGTNQEKLQQMAHTGDYGVRMVDDRYCVATGTHFEMEIGQCFDLILENGTVLPCVLSDVKADADTDEANIITVKSDCASEFTIDKDSTSQKVLLAGDLSLATEEWDSRVVEIRVYDENVLY